MLIKLLYKFLDKYYPRVIAPSVASAINITMPKEDIDHLHWVYNRFIHIYDINENIDYLRRYRTIVGSIDSKNIDVHYTYRNHTHIYKDSLNPYNATSICCNEEAYNKHQARFEARQQLNKLKHG